MTGRRRRSVLGWLFYPIWPGPRDLVYFLVIGKRSKDQLSDKALLDDAQWAISEQQASGSRILLWFSLVVIAAFFIWASLAQIDEVVKGSGKVVPSRQVQIIQSLDGGIVEELMVRTGEEVQAGQVLLRIDTTRFSSSLGESRAEWLALLAKAARLQALAENMPFQAPEIVLEESPEVAAMERELWQKRTEELAIAINIARDQLVQRQQELRETQANLAQAASSCQLTSRELNVTRPLLKSGAVSEVDLLRLQRDVAKFCGEEQAAKAQIERLQAAISESQSKLEEAEISIRNTARDELSDVRSRLAALSQSQLALADRVRLADIRSPVNGTVKTVLTNTVGGVVEPGEEVLEIVPNDDTLLLDVRVSPRDIAFLHPNQEAEVRFTAYDFAVYGGLDGEVEQIGADTFTDEDGNAYYNIKVRTDQNYVRNPDNPIIPGMVADVSILTGKRTVMQYLLKPILRAKNNALTER
ncbi:HlyD family type I secretion periplasmic adaptor subunit [Neopusillimonas maritima]|uniref:Membrane fusion protein (MFP) family protein n=1 Tax=Neopusillimonas maritima TaxID=2026239 RepID=A0ABX9MUT2_9BURK|nr:HlyD family type I secretion periplasmic adaptor subunit [Neopusillimonas maritima]RII81859.1 secretion protein HylD [Neopusillimonas maritima]